MKGEFLNHIQNLTVDIPFTEERTVDGRNNVVFYKMVVGF
jgi:hypothetical protein